MVTSGKSNNCFNSTRGSSRVKQMLDGFLPHIATLDMRTANGGKMEVIPCGAEVVLKRAEYHGVITGINIRDNRATYEVSYYESGTYKSNWYCDYEFIISAEQTKVPIGFRHI